MTPTSRGARAGLLAAILIFLAHGWWLTGSLPIWHEEVSTHAARSIAVVQGIAPDADLDEIGPTPIPTCESSGALFVRSDVRPVAALCAGGLAWPVLVSPYAAGVSYWPLQLFRPVHGGDPVALRRVSLVIGVLSLLALFGLVARYRDQESATATVLVASVLSPFLHLHSLLVVYEHVPTLLLLAALLVLGSRLAERPRLAIAGALVGLAIASNIKALVVGVPVAGLALWRVPDLRATARHSWPTFLTGTAAVALPFVALALADPYGGVSGQLSQRAASLVANLAPSHLLAEVDNALVFFVDFGFYLDVAAGQPSPLPWAFRILSLLALGNSSLALVRLARREPANLAAAAAGAVLWTFVLFVALVYRQTPAANYGPIVHVHAIAIGSALVDLGRALASRVAPTRTKIVVGSVVFAGLATLAAATHRHGDRRDHMPLSIDAHALRTVSVWLAAHDDGTPVFVTTYNLVGVLDAMAATRDPTIAVHEVLGSCREDAPTCRRDRLAALFRDSARPTRVIVPLQVGPIDEHGADRLARDVCDAATSIGYLCLDESRASTRTGVEVLGVLRVEPKD